MRDNVIGARLCVRHLPLQTPVPMKKLGFRGFSEEVGFQPCAPRLPPIITRNASNGDNVMIRNQQLQTPGSSSQAQGVAEMLSHHSLQQLSSVGPAHSL